MRSLVRAALAKHSGPCIRITTTLEPVPSPCTEGVTSFGATLSAEHLLPVSVLHQHLKDK